MKILFQNHSSLLLQHGDEYLLTDPWYNQPAFGSWLPAFAPYIHPTYLAALDERLSILISHAHDDHFDDRLLEIFNKNTHIITGDFRSPSVINRLKRIGFENISTVGENEVEFSGLKLSSYIVEEFSHDDAMYLIRNNDGAVIHANDNWQEFETRHEELIKERVASYPKHSVLLFSQTNSASGYPLNYRNFSDSEKNSLLRTKVARMVESGLRNAEKLNLPKMFSYAGFGNVYVKGQKYDELGFLPTARFLKRLLQDEGITSPVEIENFYPGDSVILPEGNIVKAFASGYRDENIKKVTTDFYHTYGNIDECLSYRPLDTDDSILDSWLDDFLSEFSAFCVSRVEGPDPHFSSLIGKTFSMEVEGSENTLIKKSIEIGVGLIDYEAKPNKHCFANGATVLSILKGEALFEDLYSGYNAEWSRNPSDVYNRDMVMMIVMFSYVYKERLSQTYKEKHLSHSDT